MHRSKLHVSSPADTVIYCTHSILIAPLTINMSHRKQGYPTKPIWPDAYVIPAYYCPQADSASFARPWLQQGQSSDIPVSLHCPEAWAPITPSLSPTASQKALSATAPLILSAPLSHQRLRVQHARLIFENQGQGKAALGRPQSR